MAIVEWRTAIFTTFVANKIDEWVDKIKNRKK